MGFALVSKREDGFMSLAAAEAKLRNAADEQNMAEVPERLSKCERKGDLVRCRDVDDEVAALEKATGGRACAKLEAELRERQAAHAVLSKRMARVTPADVDRFIARKKSRVASWRIGAEEFSAWLKGAPLVQRWTTEITDEDILQHLLVQAAEEHGVEPPVNKAHRDLWIKPVAKRFAKLAEQHVSTIRKAAEPPCALSKSVARDMRAASAITFPSSRIKL